MHFFLRNSKATIGVLSVVFVMPTVNSSLPCLAQAEEQPRPGPTNFSTPPTTSEEAKTQMKRMLEDDYAYWAGGRDSKLTVEAIGKLQRESKLTGGQAAMIGSLALALDWRHGLVDRVSYDDLVKLADGDTVMLKTTKKFVKKREDRVHNAKLRSWVLEYRTEFSNLASNVSSEGPELWGKFDGPSVQSIHQGQIGDCYWLSAIEAVVLRRPDIVRRSIKQLGPDTFELRFLGHQEPMRVRVTDGDMTQFNIDREHGCWLTALALGEARIRDANRKTNQFWKVTPLGVLDHGGSQCQVLHLLTGRDYKSVSLKKHSERQINEILEEAMRKDIPVGLTSKDHTLSIKEYDPKERTVTILNPWGSTDKYKMPGSEVKVQMEEGVFQISLRDMCRYFATINVPRSLEKG